MRRVWWLAMLLGCSGGGDALRGVAPPPSTPSPEPSVAPAEGGLQGLVRWVGTAEPPPAVVDPAVPGCEATRPSGALSTGPDAGLAGVVVELPGAPAAVLPNEVVLTGRACAVHPRVAVLPAGGTLRVRNADPVLWTFHLRRMDGGQARHVQDLAVPPGHPGLVWTLDQPGRYRVDSDRWGPGLGWVVVPEPGRALVSDAEGRFAAPDLPAGAWTARWWHEVAGEGQAAVEGPPDGPASLYLDLPLKK
jgi:hypothetical protein